MIDLAVLGQDPRFGGGGRAQTCAFLDGARTLGCEPVLLHAPHPGLGERRAAIHRIEALHQLRAARRLTHDATAARALWVVATMAANGGAAPRTRRPYSCWIGTTIDSEWRGRAPGISRTHRAAAGLSLPMLRRLERRVLRGATRVYATSASSRATVAATAGVEHDSVGVLPIPVDTKRFSPEPTDAWHNSRAQPVAVFVGRGDDPRKNVALLLDAARLVPEVSVRLVGSRPTLPLPANVEALGPVVDVPAALRGATLFVLPSRQEGFGIVVAEALAAGLPVVTTPSGGPEELVRRSGGGVVLDGFGAEELAAALQGLLEDEEALERMRTDGRAYVERTHSREAFLHELRSALAEDG